MQLIVWIIAAASCLAAVNTDARPALLDSDFDNLAEQLLSDLKIPGLSVAVIHDDKITSKGYGYAILPSTRATNDTLWFTGSTTKAMVAAAAGLLVQDDENHGDFKWTSRLSDLLPGIFALSEGYQSLHTTLEDALSHRSGLPRHDSSYGWGNASVTDVVASMRYLPLSAEPRTRWQYCNIMFGAVGAILERRTGMTIEAVLRKLIWQPLGMKSTTFTLSDALKSGRLARGYSWVEDGKDGKYYVPEPYLDIMPIAGAGATMSSVNDYALWIRALLDAYSSEDDDRTDNHNDGEAKRTRNPLTASLVHELWTPRSILPINPSLDPITYSLGWMGVRIGRHSIVTHSGGVPGFGTNVFLIPELNFGFVAVGNNVDTASQAGSHLFLAIMNKLDSRIEEEDHAGLEMLMTASSAAAFKPTDIQGVQKLKMKNVKKAKRHPHPTSNHHQSTVLSLSEYTGIYSHSAYGTLNISISQDRTRFPTAFNQVPLTSPDTADHHFSLLAQPSKRIWPSIYILRHSMHNIFEAKIFWINGADEGCGSAASTASEGKTTGRNLRCKNSTSWEEVGSGDAIFEYGLSGEIEKFGIELDDELVRFADEVGDWRRGMIWFDKVMV